VSVTHFLTVLSTWCALPVSTYGNVPLSELGCHPFKKKRPYPPVISVLLQVSQGIMRGSGCISKNTQKQHE
jgi:hypothetical protein